MLQAGKLGFRCSHLLRCFYAVNCGSPKFNFRFDLNVRMSTKRRRVSSSAEGLESLTSAKASTSEKKTPKEIVRANGGLEDEDIEKMTVQQLKSRLRSLGIPARGVKQELVSALKSSMNSLMDAETSSALDQMGSEKEQTVRTYSRRKAGKVSESESNYAVTKNSLVATGGKGTNLKMQSSEHKEPVIDSVETEDGKSSRTEKKIFSSVATSDTVAHATDNIDEPWTVLTHKKPQKDWIAYNPKNMRPPSLTADSPNIKLMSWNVNGLRALLKLKTFLALQQRENFDVLCLQETKLQEKDVDAIRHNLLEGYDNCYWTCSVSKLGYSGTAIISRIKPLSVRYGLGIADHDSEGRLVTVEFDDFYLLNGYVPNSGDGLRRLSYRITQWDTSLSDYMKDLERSKPVILTGDLNCAHQEIDIYNPAGNKKSAGFTIEERESFQKNFLDKGFVDTFRKQHPNVVAYTYWGYRHGGRKTNKGWRLDYFLASEQIAGRVYDSYILPDVGGSDHSPIGLILKL